jgi:hypothetical protein
MILGGIRELQGVEADCLRRFRLRARKLMARDPKLSRHAAFARAVTAMPHTANRYMRARHQLATVGVLSLPLWDGR